MDTYKNTDEGQRENILYTAKALFLKLGYRKTTIALIAEKAGVSDISRFHSLYPSFFKQKAWLYD